MGQAIITRRFAPLIGPNSATFDFFRDGSALALYRFNNNYNDSGGIFNAQPNGSSFTSTSKYGPASVNCQNNGVYVDLPVTTRYFSVSGWHYKTQGFNSVNGYLYDFRLNNTRNGRGYLYATAGVISLSNDSTASNQIGDIYVNGVKLTSSFTFPQNQWVHVVVSVTDSNATRQIWDRGGLRIGNRSDGTTDGLSGFFDQVRIFNRSLTQSEVTQLFQEVQGPL